MKLQQLRYLCEVAKRGLNVSEAANALYTSQPGVSKQIRLLEEELGVRLFVRKGKRITEITPPGEAALAIARRILEEVENLKRVGEEFSAQASGSLAIATTHTQARYALPPVIQKFRAQYPQVKLSLKQGNPVQIAEAVMAGEADLAIATESLALYDKLVTLPCYQWNHCVVAPPKHPLFKEPTLTLEAIARYPLITYDFAFTGRTQIQRAFEQRGLKPNVVLTALDSDVIKTYVALGLGVGIVARMAYDPELDKSLKAVDASHLFESSLTRIALRRGAYLRAYVYDFIQLFAPHLSRSVVEATLAGGGSDYEL
ncbi:HTH-type transcriptional regulator CysB [Pelomicrobium methylotrophicum]|uniref:HTH-type transcriptional regulator CysB n=1 Tax=Pelomicrobium methylotrophicum TaxID=2602750 RepID=A0A5C7ELQ5_9PROT|nr:HTH-type transcriptional regulator CysB [Pelomicrobium methylotrophicum]TXF12044.1 HTH-type transcriptional regulator CysB [Pelomicrobium methylotrophicum]